MFPVHEKHHDCRVKDEDGHKHLDINRKRKLFLMHLACHKYTASQTQEMGSYYKPLRQNNHSI